MSRPRGAGGDEKGKAKADTSEIEGADEEEDEEEDEDAPELTEEDLRGAAKRILVQQAHLFKRWLARQGFAPSGDADTDKTEIRALVSELLRKFYGWSPSPEDEHDGR